MVVTSEALEIRDPFTVMGGISSQTLFLYSSIPSFMVNTDEYINSPNPNYSSPVVTLTPKVNLIRLRI